MNDLMVNSLFISRIYSTYAQCGMCGLGNAYHRILWVANQWHSVHQQVNIFPMYFLESIKFFFYNMNKVLFMEYNFTWLKKYQVVFESTVCKIYEIQISVRKISIINTSFDQIKLQGLLKLSCINFRFSQKLYLNTFQLIKQEQVESIVLWYVALRP